MATVLGWASARCGKAAGASSSWPPTAFACARRLPRCARSWRHTTRSSGAPLANSDVVLAAVGSRRFCAFGLGRLEQAPDQHASARDQGGAGEGGEGMGNEVAEIPN